MTPTPSPVVPTADQAVTIAWLERCGADPLISVEVDAGALDVCASDLCPTDWMHGWATVCLPLDPDDPDSQVRICPGCGLSYLRWFPGEHVSLDILMDPAAATVVKAA